MAGVLLTTCFSVHASQWLPVQYFALKHPEFDHYWNWEMDVRYTGHHYELLESLGTWTKKQPRKGLWERNSRFYVPGFHGDYATEFTDYIQGKYLQGPEGRREDLSIWGPDPPPGQAITPLDDLPPLQAPTPIHDNFEWGVGEDADLITLLPMFNPDTTHYALRAGYYNYPQSLLPQGPPRRATIITFYRLSHRLLSTMHLENTRSPGHHMSSEQWPQSVALHHGFKAVYAPHSVYIDRQWPAQATNFIFNNGDSRRVIKAFKDMAALGEGSGGWESVFGMDREHSFVPSTFYYRTDFATRLYKRLLGYEIDGIGGEVVSPDQISMLLTFVDCFYSGKRSMELSAYHQCCSTKSRTWMILRLFWNMTKLVQMLRRKRTLSKKKKLRETNKPYRRPLTAQRRWPKMTE